jgi:hypothetical protein
MAKEGKKKVKSNTPSSPKYVTSDEDTLSSNDNNDDALVMMILFQVNFVKIL